jgi:hypothetical protein
MTPIYDPARLAVMEDGVLADLYFCDLDMDPDMTMDNTKAVIAEVERRGFNTEILLRHWRALQAEEAAGQLPLAV